MKNLSNLFKANAFDLFDLRVDIEKALKKANITVTGAGCGDGKADISIEVDGKSFWLDIRQV